MNRSDGAFDLFSSEVLTKGIDERELTQMTQRELEVRGWMLETVERPESAARTPW